MKTPYTPPGLSTTCHHVYSPHVINVIFVAKSSHHAVSAIALASSLCMNGVPFLCASYPGRNEQLDLALGATAVIKLPDGSLHPCCHLLAGLMQRAREECAVLIIDAYLTPTFKFHDLPGILNLRRGDTLSVVLSMEAGGKIAPESNFLWNCKADHNLLHVTGSDSGNLTDDELEEDWMSLPTWHCGEITDDKAEVLTRSGFYHNLPPIPDLCLMFYKAPSEYWIHQDPKIKAVVEMLASVKQGNMEDFFHSVRCW